MEYKDFQKRAIKRIVEGYKSNNRFLIADEVGLGKTIVAKGVIRCLAYLEYLKAEEKDNFEYRVLYLCSNLNIAEQNKSKLGVGKRQKEDFWDDYVCGEKNFEKYAINRESGASVENRTTMLLKKINEESDKITLKDLRKECEEILGKKYLKDEEKDFDYEAAKDKEIKLNIIPITPKTSIEIKRGGHIEERRFIRNIMQELYSKKEKYKLYELLKKKNFLSKPKYLEDINISGIKENVLEKFAENINKLSELTDKLNEQLNLSSMNENAPEDAELKKEWENSWELLRELFAVASVKMLKYDFVIMDEFQNFNEILQKANKTKTDAINEDNMGETMLLENIFKNEDKDGRRTKILMLSATPFRMYIDKKHKENSVNIDNANIDNANIAAVCDFLDENLHGHIGDKLNDYKEALLEFSRNSQGNKKEVSKKKAEFQEKMAKVFSRMERNAVERELSPEVWFKKSIETETPDEEIACGKISELKEYLNEIEKKDIRSVSFLNYAIDTPYMATFMHNKITEDSDDGYKWKKEWDNKVKKKLLKDDYGSKLPKLYIRQETYEECKASLGTWHGVFNEVLKKILDLDEEAGDNEPGAARLLWIPSCVNKDRLEKAFEEHKDYGKTIVFSKYVMTPRMLATVVSYESRRRLCREIEKISDGSFEDNLRKAESVFNKKDEHDTGAKLSTYKRLSELIKNIKKNFNMDEDIEGIKCIKKTFEDAIGHYKQKKGKKPEDNEKEKKLVKGLAKAFIEEVILNEHQGLLAVWATEGFPYVESEDKNKWKEKLWEGVKDYCEHGRLRDVLDEWLYLCYESNQDLGEFLGLKDNKFLSYIKSSMLSVDLYTRDDEEYLKTSGKTVQTYFARCLGISKDDDKLSAIKGLQQSFNSPFAPFVFATTSIGQEGLDFHYYADKIVHWKLPSNPVDFEQREGRINRYNCFAIRKKLIDWYSEQAKSDDYDIYEIFNKAFEKAEKEIIGKNEEKVSDIRHSGLVPHWILFRKKDGKYENAKIQRIVPYFYLSKMLMNYNENLKVLQLYRSVIGQNDPDEVMERLMSLHSLEDIEELFVDFSPYNDDKS